MNLKEKCTEKEQDLIRQAGVIIENKDYTKEELEKCQVVITDYIMSHSSKNGDIDKLNSQYNGILRKII